MTRITYMGQDITPRSSNGRFKRTWRKTKIAALLTFIGILGFTAYGEQWVTEELHTPIVHADITMEAKLDVLKDDIVTRLASCETKGVKEPDAAIVLDTNSEMSIGSWQFQIKTIQHYVKLFEGRDISRVEAIQLAVDHDRARALASRIIWEEEGGIFNWRNCERALNLAPEIAILKKLTD